VNYESMYRVAPSTQVKLSKWSTDQVKGKVDKERARVETQANADRLAELQYNLYAENKRSFLLVFQGMDTAGKDGTIRRVLGELNPQGCRVASFKKPTDQELAHDYLWRVHRETPAIGMVQVFNRSHYEDVLIVRVNNFVPKAVWSKRYAQINQFESLLASRGTIIMKFFLHISRKEQKERFLARLEDPAKRWKFNAGDLEVRKQWGDYMKAYEAVLSKCSKAAAPWYVIPSDRKWYRNFVISEIIRKKMESLNYELPEADVDADRVVIPD